MQQSGLVAQAVLPRPDVSIGVSLMFFAQNLGGSIFICVAQSVFNNALVTGLGQIPGVNPSIILETGATQLRTAADPANLPAVLEKYNDAIVTAWYVALAAAAFSILPALGVEWKNVKGLKQGGPKGKEEKVEEEAVVKKEGGEVAES